MNLDKATLVFRGKPLLLHQIELLRGLGFEEVIVAVGRRRPLPIPEDVVVVEDRFPGLGPLAGLHAALSAARNPACFVLACDMPFLAAPLAVELLNMEGKPIKICLRRGFMEPFPGSYAKEIVVQLEERLRQGRLGVQDFIRSVPHAVVPEERVALLDPEGRSFVNLNTWEALRCAASK